MMRGSDRWRRQIIIAALRHYDETPANRDGDSPGRAHPEPGPTDLEVRAVREAVEAGNPGCTSRRSIESREAFRPVAPTADFDEVRLPT